MVLTLILLSPVILLVLFLLRLFGVFSFSYLWFPVVLIAIPILLFCIFVLPTIWLIFLLSVAAA